MMKFKFLFISFLSITTSNLYSALEIELRWTEDNFVISAAICLDKNIKVMKTPLYDQKAAKLIKFFRQKELILKKEKEQIEKNIMEKRKKLYEKLPEIKRL